MKKILIVIMLILIALPFYASDLDDKLFDAIENNDIKVIKELIKKGADVNAINNNGYTVLINACHKFNLKIIKYLVEKGADINVETQDGYTALVIPSHEGYLEIVKYLVENGANDNAKEKALVYATHMNQLEIVKYLIKKSTDVNTKRHTGYPVLIEASINGCFDILKCLVENGANVNAIDYNGQTALMKASIEGRLDIVKFLVENGADFNVVDNEGNRVLYYAKKYEADDVVEYLEYKIATTNETNILRYVTADIGLRMREASNLKAKKLGVIPYGEEVVFIEEIGSEITISGATGKWTKINWNGKVGWVFGGFLADNMKIEYKINGTYYLEDNDNFHYTFYNDGTWTGIASGLDGFFEIDGTYEIIVNKIIIKAKWSKDREFEIISNNEILEKYNNGDNINIYKKR